MRSTRTLAVACAATLFALGGFAPAHAAPAGDTQPAPEAIVICTVSDLSSGSRGLFIGSTDSILKGGKYKVTISVKPKKCNGKVVIKDGKKKLKTVTLKKGKVTYTFPKSLKAGTHTITYSYSRPGGTKRKPLTWKQTVEVAQPAAFAAESPAYTGYTNNTIPVVMNIDYRGTLKGAQITWVVGGQADAVESSGRIALPDSAKGFTGQVTAWFSASAYARYLTPGATVPLTASLYPQLGKAAATTSITITVASNEFPVSLGGEPGTVAPGTYTVPAGKENTSCSARTYARTTSGTEAPGPTVTAQGAVTIVVQPTDSKLSIDGCGGAPVRVA